MSSSSRTSSRRLSGPPTQRPTIPSSILGPRNAGPTTPPPRPSLHSNMSTLSTSSTASLMDCDTVFDDSPSRSGTPSSPSTPWDSPPSPSSSLLFNKSLRRSSVGVLEKQPSAYETLLEGKESEYAHDTPPKSGRRPKSLNKLSLSSAARSQRPPLGRQPKIDDVLHHKPRIPGTFGSQNTDLDMETESLGYYPASASIDESAEHVITSTSMIASKPTGRRSLSVTSESITTTTTHGFTVPGFAGTIDNKSKDPRFRKWKNSKQLREINNNIYNCIKSHHAAREKSVNKPTKKIRPGWIYIFESPKEAPAHVKIGKTLNDPQKRRAEWESCGLPLLEVEDSYRNAFDHYSLVESLIKAELHNERRKYKCSHEHHAPKKWVEHEEWYEIDTQTALKSVHRWRHWILEQAPFDENGLLTPYWHWRVQKLPKFIHDVIWDTWTHPNVLDYLDFQFEQIGQGHYAQIRAHLSRKDFHFCLTGGMMLFVLYTQFGIAGVTWGLLALFIL
jgi:hypothetical protein